MTVQGLLKLMSCLVYDYMSEPFCAYLYMVENTLKKAVRGDHSMIINAGPTNNNKKRAAPDDQDKEEEEEQRASKRQRAMSELELEQMRVALEIKQAEARALKIENDRKEMENQKQQIQNMLDNQTKAFDVYSQLCNKGAMDDATRKLFVAPLMTMVSNAAVAEVSGEPKPASIAAASASRITVSGVVAEMGLTGLVGVNELKQIGAGMARRYREKYNENPPQQQSMGSGGLSPANLYTERDKDLMMEEIRKVVLLVQQQSRPAAIGAGVRGV